MNEGHLEPFLLEIGAKRGHTLPMEPQKEYVLRTVEERGVRLIRLWFTDVLGQHKSVAITPAELEAAFEEGVQFDGSSIDGFSRVQESDVLARPDASTFELLPWADPSEPSGRIFCDIHNPDGTPFEGDPRQILRRNLDAAKELGYSFFCAPEVEFYYFQTGDPAVGPIPVDRASYFDLTTADVSSDLRKRTIHTLEAMGIPVEYSFHEAGHSQHEIDLRYTDALQMADNLMTLRLVVRKVGGDANLFASFMPKPMADQAGSGLHTHMSLFRDDKNAFYDPDDDYNLSEVARQFIAGILHHAREISAITNQLVNSYKRLVIGDEAPVYISWARNNRSALVRVPVVKTGKTSSTRIEYRALDSAANPYLSFAMILGAGMKGITEQYELPAETLSNLHEVGQPADNNLDALPQSLGEALDVMESSELAREVLGAHVYEWFIRNKREEWAAYQRHVTPFEIERYFPTV